MACPDARSMIWPRSLPDCRQTATVPCGPATAIQTVPTGHSGVPPAGPATPVVAGHGADDGFAHHAVAVDVVEAYAQQVVFRLDGVADHAAPEVGRGAGHGCEPGGDGASRTAFGRGERQVALREQVVDDRLDRGRFVAEDIFGNDRAQLFELRFDFVRHLFAFDLVGRQP